MRKDGIPYNPNPFVPRFPAKKLEDMTLDEIKNKYLKMCAKSNGDPSVCSKCQNPCREGKRAIQVLSGEIYNDPPIPLYGGKTLIEKAREENLLRRQKLEEEKMKESKPKERQFIDNWYEDSLKSGNQIEWIMEKFSMTKAQAQKKVYSYRYTHHLTDKTYKTKKTPPTDIGIESKLDALMKAKEKQKEYMDECYKQYIKAKEEYDKIDEKINTLCNAIDIMNE